MWILRRFSCDVMWADVFKDQLRQPIQPGNFEFPSCSWEDKMTWWSCFLSGYHTFVFQKLLYHRCSLGHLYMRLVVVPAFYLSLAPSLLQIKDVCNGTNPSELWIFLFLGFAHRIPSKSFRAIGILRIGCCAGLISWLIDNFTLSSFHFWNTESSWILKLAPRIYKLHWEFIQKRCPLTNAPIRDFVYCFKDRFPHRRRFILISSSNWEAPITSSGMTSFSSSFLFRSNIAQESIIWSFKKMSSIFSLLNWIYISLFAALSVVQKFTQHSSLAGIRFLNRCLSNDEFCFGEKYAVNLSTSIR